MRLLLILLFGENMFFPLSLSFIPRILANESEVGLLKREGDK